MSADLFLLEGHAYSWRRLCELRREQLAARRVAQGVQNALFEMHDDCRPASERDPARRYAEPGLFEWAPVSRLGD